MDQEKQAVDDAGEEAPGEALYIVAIGASAGGLEAQRDLLSALPSGLPAAYVIVQHLAPDHVSLLSQILSPETDMDVIDLTDGSPPRVDTIYVTPPNRDVIFKNGVFRLVAPSLGFASPKPSVDRLLISLAEEHGERSVAIILSGTGSDGSYGVQAIRSAGGITIAQDDKTAKYDGMPLSAVETGCIDLILSPREISAQIGQIIKSPDDLLALKQSLSNASPETDLLKMVLSRKRVDFRDYKATTVQRRIERRMVAQGISEPQEYIEYCRENPDEIDAFFKDMLISVTSFFRDRQEFEAMKVIVREIVESRQNKPIRVWVAGCATGQEAYSIAMIFTQLLEEFGVKNNISLKVYATDISADALKTARKGVYPISSVSEIPEEFVAKFVHIDKEHIRISKRIADRIIFTEHNVASDVPFSEIDLLCCRNLLIYLNQSLQEQVLARLHYALSQDGFLFLGTAESVPISDTLYRRVSGFSHTYRKRHGSSADVVNLIRRTSKPKRRWISSQTEAASSHLFQAEKALFDQLAEAVGENAILVDSEMRIDRVYGDISKYIAIDKSSRLTFDISMLAPKLAREARMLATLALRQERQKKGGAYPIKEDGGPLVQLCAIPLKAPELDDGFVLISFHNVEEKPVLPAKKQEIGPDDALQRIEDLNNELKATRDELQQTIEELETSTEELQASNEELQATNEELQATNEEYETTNEELQSTNEELITLNEELHVSKGELEQINLEQKAIVDSIESPIIWVNVALNVVNLNQAAAEFYDIGDSMVAPHISKISIPDFMPSFLDICRDIIINGKSVSKEFINRGVLYIVNFTPYFTELQELRGIAVVITKSNHAVEITGMIGDLFTAISSELPVYFMHRRRDGALLELSPNTSAALFAEGRDAGSVLNVRDLYDEDTCNRVLALDDAFLESGERSAVNSVKLTSKDGARRLFLEVHRNRIEGVGDEGPTVFAIGVDIEERSRLSKELNHMLNVLPAMIMHRDRKGTIRQLSEGSASIAGYTREEMIGRNIVDLVGKEYGERIIREDNELLDSDMDASEFYSNAIRPDGSVAWLRSERARYKPFDEEEELVFATATDITEIHNAEAKASRYRELLELTVRNAGVDYWIVDLETNELTWSDGVYAIHGETPESYKPELESAIAFYHPDDAGMVRSVVERAIRKGEPFEFKARIVRKNGVEIPVRSICDLFKRRGEVSALIGIILRLDRAGALETRH